MDEERISFPVGDIALEGLISAPREAVSIGVVVCHPHPLYGGEMHNNVVTALTRGFQRAGYVTLRFNFRGVGGSEGRHDDGVGEIDDVKAATACLAERASVSTVVVAGYSFGSLVGLQAGAEDPRVQFLIGVALPIARRDASFLEDVAKPKLLISGDRDNVSPHPELTKLFERLTEPKQLLFVKGADHFFAGFEQKVADAPVRFLANTRHDEQPG